MSYINHVVPYKSSAKNKARMDFQISCNGSLRGLQICKRDAEFGFFGRSLDIGNFEGENGQDMLRAIDFVKNNKNQKMIGEVVFLCQEEEL